MLIFSRVNFIHSLTLIRKVLSNAFARVTWQYSSLSIHYRQTVKKRRKEKKKKRIHPVEFPIRETENFNDPYALFIFLPDGIQGNSLAPINSLLYGILMKKKKRQRF